MTWPIESSRVVYENPWMSVREDRVTRPDGTSGIYGVMQVRHAAVFVVAVTDLDEVVLITVDRHTVGSSIEIPAGGTDGEEPLRAAQRELLEETGMVATGWRRLGGVDSLNGICIAPGVVFLATGLSMGGSGDAVEAQATESSAREAQAEEGITAIRRVPISRLREMIGAGEISDGETLAALLLAFIALGRVI